MTSRVFMSIIVFYSLRKILRFTGNSSKKIVKAIESITYRKIPLNYNDPLYDYYYTDFSGDSFLLNPTELLLYAFKYTYKEVAQYIGLASYRNYSHYTVTGDKSLDLFHSPVDQDTIEKNRLLRVKKGRIYFYYEEDINRRILIWQD